MAVISLLDHSSKFESSLSLDTKCRLPSIAKATQLHLNIQFQKRFYFHTLEQSLMFFEGHLAYSIGPKHPPQGKFVLGLLLEPNLLVHTHLEETLYSTEVILTFLLYF